MNKILRRSLIGAGVLLAGLGVKSCFDYLPVDENPTDPASINYSKVPVMVQDYSINKFGQDLYTFDNDKDGQVDELGWSSTPYWVAPGHADSNNANVRVMTPEIRQKLSAHMKSGQDISRLLAEEAWRQSHKRDSLEATNQK